jgi:hypothetical protein
MKSELKTEFCERLRETNREGIENIIAFLEEKGFFLAPASSRFHFNSESGLLVHSLNVCDAAMDIREIAIRRDPSLEKQLPMDSVIIASLLHDVCKTDIYKPISRKLKFLMKLWPGSPTYHTDYGYLPLGHGEKSVIYLMQNGLKMSNDEIMAIRWHMGAWDISFQGGSSLGNYNKAKHLCPLVTVIQCADEMTTNIMECRPTLK